MVLSNAERQARYRERLKALAASGVTPGDINRARRLMYENYVSEPINRALPWDDWVASSRKPKNRQYWREMLPDSGDLADWEEFGEDAGLLAKVGAVIEAINKVPEPD